MRIDPVKVYRLRMKLESVGFTTDQVLALSNAAAIALVTNAALTGPQVRALESLIGDTVNPGDTIDANMFAIQRDRFAKVRVNTMTEKEVEEAFLNGDQS